MRQRKHKSAAAAATATMKTITKRYKKIYTLTHSIKSDNF